MIRFFFLLLFLQANQCFGQQLSKDDEESRAAADEVIIKYFQNDIKDRKYIIFSSSNTQFVVLVEFPNRYQEYYFNTSNSRKMGPTSVVNYQTSDSLLNKMFDINSYRQGYFSFESDFYKAGYEIASGAMTYFAFVTENGKKYTEARLSFFVKPNPIDVEIYFFFTERLLYYSRVNSK
jgi:hypothetical protein